MPELRSTVPSDQSATLRQLKALVFVLVLSNIGLGIFAFYQLRATDERYSLLLTRSIPVLDDLRELTADMAEVTRVTGIPLLNASADERPQAVKRARAAILREHNFREELMKDPLPPGLAEPRGDIPRQGGDFDAMTERIVGFVESGRVSDAVELRQELLRTAADRYSSAIAKAASTIEGASLKANDELSVRTGSMSTVVLGLASWPVIVLVALLVLTAVFVVVLMVLFRGREMSDVP